MYSVQARMTDRRAITRALYQDGAAIVPYARVIQGNTIHRCDQQPCEVKICKLQYELFWRHILVHGCLVFLDTLHIVTNLTE